MNVGKRKPLPKISTHLSKKKFSKLRIAGHFLKLMKNNTVFNGEMLEAYSLKAKSQNKYFF